MSQHSQFSFFFFFASIPTQQFEDFSGLPTQTFFKRWFYFLEHFLQHVAFHDINECENLLMTDELKKKKTCGN